VNNDKKKDPVNIRVSKGPFCHFLIPTLVFILLCFYKEVKEQKHMKVY